MSLRAFYLILALYPIASQASSDCAPGPSREIDLVIERMRKDDGTGSKACWITAREKPGLLGRLSGSPPALVDNGYSRFDFICRLTPGASLEARITPGCDRTILEPAAPDRRAVPQLVEELASDAPFDSDRAGRVLLGYTRDRGIRDALEPYADLLSAVSERGSLFQRSWASLIILETKELDPSGRVTHILRVLERGYLDEPIMLRYIAELGRYPNELGRIAPVFAHLLDNMVFLERVPETILAALGALLAGKPAGTSDVLSDLARTSAGWRAAGRFAPEHRARVEAVARSLDALICAIDPGGRYFTSAFPPKEILSCRTRP